MLRSALLLSLLAGMATTAGAWRTAPRVGVAHRRSAACGRSRNALAQLSEDDEEGLEELEEVLRNGGRRPAGDQRPRFQRALGIGDGRPRRRPRSGQSSNSPVRFTRESTQLFNLPGTLHDAYNDFLERPGQPLLLGTLSLLVGFYLAGALSTIFGAAGFWEPTIALGPLFIGEAITRRYYMLPANERSPTLRLLNALKVGFYLGVVIDALKLAG